VKGKIVYIKCVKICWVSNDMWHTQLDYSINLKKKKWLVSQFLIKQMHKNINTNIVLFSEILTSSKLISIKKI